ncbi:MAG TPA: trigger factor [Plasticicumulans sp.]|uniref:trigger factor n=1 Tax=Plasticicumulans sp. TaxID=2307179 RepID=UPI002BDDE600|nr:trigger factor [Plasticicumulans sp.]HMV39164.1 trigger factor [Plasticicumulans sp.]HMW29135.1 trigger factor [Plasticicumulans sp.]HMW43086.1 trigger factor [Plasticicumulans sp.]HMX53926.1 trigger factor [Plasticicumulans sp.]HMZ09979.1 trigger factor [Plasticicumulans sp.]
MQVSVEELGGLERRLTVQLPAARIEQEIEQRLQDLSRRVKLDGFRPGKVPLKVVKRMYGGQVRQEVLGELMQSSFQEAVSGQNLRPAAGPQISPSAAAEGDFAYAATFEVLPEFELQGFEGIAVERPVAEVSDADIDSMLETLRKQRTVWTPVERPAQTGDRVTVSFEGTIDGVAFPGGKGDDVPVVLGAGGMLPDFENGLIGIAAGEAREIAVSFPEGYHAQELAGRTARFALNAGVVAEPSLPPVDEEFAKAFGVEDGSVESLRAALRDNMTRELGQGIKTRVKKQVMDALLAANPIELPKVLVTEEIDRIAQQAGFPAASAGNAEADKIKEGVFAEEARRRVALGLLISKLVVQEKLTADPARVVEQLTTMASTYQDPNEVMQWYLKNPQAMEGLRALALEDTVVDWVLARASVTEQPSTFDAVMRPAPAPAATADNAA